MLIESERAILAIVMDRPEFAALLFDNLDGSYFHGACLDVFNAINDLHGAGADFRWASVRDKIGGKFGSEFWQSLMDSTRGVHFSGAEAFLKERIQTLKTEGAKRKLAAEIGQVAVKTSIEEGDIDYLDETIRGMRMIGRQKETPQFSEAVAAYQEHIRLEASDITTGFPSIDRRVDGFNPGELVTIMARSGVGKTFVALNIIERLVYHIPFKMALFSLEMPKSAIVERMLEIFFGLSRQELKSQAVAGTLDIKQFETIFGKLSIYDKIYSVSELRKIVDREGYRVVFIDFLHLIRPEVVGSPYQQISQVMRDIKQMAKDTGCVAFLMHQLSRQAGSGWTPVEAAHARDSGTVEELSDFLIGVWAPGLNPDSAADCANTLRIRLLKNKRGERWAFDAHFDKSCGRIVEEEHGGFRPKAEEGEGRIHERHFDSAERD